MARRPLYGRVWLILDLSAVPILMDAVRVPNCRSLHADNAAEGNRRNNENIFDRILTVLQHDDLL